MTLTDFLLARIAEDEGVARTVQEARDRAVADDTTFDWVDDCIGAPLVVVGAERVLAECEAKRRIVAEWQTFSKVADRGAEASSLPEALTQRGIVVGLERAIRALALPYADHPDYREEWRL